MRDDIGSGLSSVVVCFDFGSTNMGSSVIKTGRSEGSLLPYFYQFRCHYPLINYLNRTYMLQAKIIKNLI